LRAPRGIADALFSKPLITSTATHLRTERRHVIPARRDDAMRRKIVAVAALGFVMAVGLAACEDKGPMQKAGEKIDRATDQDKVIGKGPLEKAGKNVDDTVKDLKK
jgi:hypothetical protein